MSNSITTSSSSESPLLRRATLSRRLDALFRTMSSDFLLREQFITDPAQITAEYLYGARLSPQLASTTNQLICAVFANPGLVRWLRRYFIKHRVRLPAVGGFIKEFSLGVVENKARHVVLALARGGIGTEGTASKIDDALLYAFQSIILVAARMNAPGLT
jgi:hypothetical protein